MRITSKDTVGLFLVAGTVGALFVHNAATHRETHLPLIADAGGAATSAESFPTVAFVDFNVVPMDGQDVLRHQIVIVRDGFVGRIGPVGVIETPADARIIEGDGSGYLAPGLVDAHVHLGDAAEEFLPLFLANGVTTVFNLEGDSRHIALRDRSRDRDFVGPTIFTSGSFVNDDVVISPDDARRLVEEQAKAGYDFIKIHGRLSEGSYAALTEAAREAGIPVLGHAPRNLPFSAVLEHGQVGVVHAEELIYTALQGLDSTQAAVVATKMVGAGIWLTPTLSTFGGITEQWASPEALTATLAKSDAQYLPSSIRRAWEKSRVYTARPEHERGRIEEMDAFHGPLVRAMNAAGVQILAGTDTPLPGMVPGFSLHDELAALHAAGMTAEEVLESATVNAGRFIRIHVDPSATFGTIEPGARADLVLIRGDPRHDLSLLRRPLGVMARGTWYERSQLDQMLLLASGTRVSEEPPSR